MLFYLFIAVLVFVVLGFISSPKFKGKVGESIVYLHYKKYLDNDKYVLINNCTLPTSNGETTQIDHILLSPYGIFVLETKNYKGWIFGDKFQKQWTQSFPKSKHRFQNPLHQNYKHTKVLGELLENQMSFDLSHLYSVVVFVGECEFKTEMPENVLHGKAWVNYVKQFNVPVLSTVAVRKAQYLIEQHRLERGRKTDKLHVKNLKSAHQSK